MVWTMKPNLAWAPPVIVSGNFDESFQAAKNHFKETNADYQKQYLINLIDKKGSQLKIGNKFTEIIKQLNDPALNYVYFDFHGECKNMKWENLSKLMTIIGSELDSNSYFLAHLDECFDQRAKMDEKTVRIVQTQSGVMRTNCMDCLDRTNVVQSVISRRIAMQQLFKLQVIGQPKWEPFEKFPILELENAFRNIWTDNADQCSLLYAGTPALKTDFTRTGKRTRQGAANDGYISLRRYYINNFCDGYNHDCVDIATGKVKHLHNGITQRPFASALKLRILGIFGAMYVASFLMNMFFPYSDNELYEGSDVKVWTLHAMVLAAVFFVGLGSILAHGREYIDDASRVV